MAPRSENPIAKVAQKKPKPAPAEIQEDSRNIAAVTQDAALSAVEQEAARAGRVGRFLGWGQEARNWQIGVIAVVGVLIMTAIYFCARQERHSDLALAFLIQAFTGALAYFIGKSRSR